MPLASQIFGNAYVTKDDIAKALGDDAKPFLECMYIVDDIIENPSEYVDIKAAIMANKLAAWRTKIGVLKQVYKSADMDAGEKKFKNNIYETLYNALEGNVDALKKVASMGMRH